MAQRKHARRRRRSTPRDWEHLPEDEILRFRVRDLGLDIHDSPLEPFIQRLYAELDARGVQFQPPCYLADEWLCPDGVPTIGIPFCLAHPRLTQIEKRMMYEVEGGDPRELMRLLRHECGHALNYAYLFHRRTRWRELFGPFSAPYSGTYHFQPYSKRYVIHLRDNYAQAHPDEDFAETFAVWLAPDSAWDEKYKDWPVMRKLRYVDRLMSSVGGEPPKVTVRETPPWSASRKTSTLAAYYDRKRREMGTDFEGYYDASLRDVFAAADDPSVNGEPASRFLRKHRRAVVDSVTRWTGHRKYDIHGLLVRLGRRCDALELSTKGEERTQLIELTSLVTTLASNAWRVWNQPHR